MISAPRDIFGPNVFAIFVHELGGAKRVAKMLHVTERSVYRWLAAKKVPRPVVLALYWETHYGRSLVDSDQITEIRLLYQRLHLLEAQYAKACDIVAGLRRLNTGTANEAYFDALEEIKPLGLDTYGPSRFVAEQKQLRANAG